MSCVSQGLPAPLLGLIMSFLHASFCAALHFHSTLVCSHSQVQGSGLSRPEPFNGQISQSIAHDFLCASLCSSVLPSLILHILTCSAHSDILQNRNCPDPALLWQGNKEGFARVLSLLCAKSSPVSISEKQIQDQCVRNTTGRFPPAWYSSKTQKLFLTVSHTFTYLIILTLMPIFFSLPNNFPGIYTSK